jgi:predicted nuclease of predicted toxin-antitoxin system
MAGRLLHLDENLPRRLAAELEARGHPARAHRALPDAPATDTGLIRSLDGDVVLVTADEGMPREHRALLRERRVPVAIVHADNETAKRETVHRWAHVMATQPPGSIRRYSPRRRG